MALTQISTAGVKDDAVTSGKIPANAVGSSELADNAVDTAAIVNNAVTTAKISDDNVTFEKIENITANQVLGRVASGTGEIQALSGAHVRSIINVADGANQTTINNNADNRVITGSGTANTLEGEANLTWDATTLKVQAATPAIEISGTNSNGGNSSLHFNANANHWVLEADNFTQQNAFAIKSGTTASSTPRLTISSDGRVGIGKTPSSTFDIETGSNANGFNLNCIGTPANYFFNVRDDNVSKFYIGNNGSIGVGTDNPFGPTGYGTIELNGATGGCVTFSDDDTQKFEVYGSDAHLGIYNRTNTKYIAYLKKGGDVELVDGNLKLASGHGIDFSATGNGSGTMSNELLDDYEEGTWVPTMTFNGNSTGLVYNQQDGRYTKIGNIVHASFVIGITDKGSSTGNWQIGGLPYNSKNDSGDRINGFVTYYGGMISVNTHISLYNSTNTSNFYGYNGDASSTSAQNLTHSHVNDSAHLRGHVIYRTL